MLLFPELAFAHPLTGDLQFVQFYCSFLVFTHIFNNQRLQHRFPSLYKNMFENACVMLYLYLFLLTLYIKNVKDMSNTKHVCVCVGLKLESNIVKQNET